MHITEKKIDFVDKETTLHIHEKLSNGAEIYAYVTFLSDKFVQYQKDLLQDFVGNFIDQASSDIHDIQEVRNNFEVGLQNVNTKLKVFAEKVHNIEYFPVKGFIQIVMDGVLMSSMIGDTSVLIFRNHKLYYSLHNTFTKGKIDLFSDFVEGDIDMWDAIVYMGVKVNDVFDKNDFRDMEEVLASNPSGVVHTIQDMLTTRMDGKHIGFLSEYIVSGAVKHAAAFKKEKDSGFMDSTVVQKFKSNVLTNKYYLTVGILSILILFMLYNILSQLIKTTNDTIQLSDSGQLVDVTIEDIKKDIYLFKTMDPTSDAKATKYHEILEKLEILEKRGKWLDDVTKLKKVLQSDYQRGFNIVYVTDLTQFDDPTTDHKANIFTFNNAELGRLGSLKYITFQKNMLIAGTKGALLGAANDMVRGSIVEFWSEEAIRGCSVSLLRNGLYCYTPSRVFAITNLWTETVTTSSPTGLPSEIGWMGVYGKANMYIFAPTIYGTTTGAFVTRYRNVLGSQTQFQPGTNYMLSMRNATGVNISSGFSSFAIDGNFLARSIADRALYQLWREGTVGISIRKVPIIGGDKITAGYSPNVKVITFNNTKYVYLFDPDNQTFTVYESRSIKTNDAFATSYNLHYLFRFTFDLSDVKVVDVEVPEITGNRPELYILTTKGVARVKLYEFVDSLVENNTLKQIGGQE